MSRLESYQLRRRLTLVEISFLESGHGEYDMDLDDLAVQ